MIQNLIRDVVQAALTLVKERGQKSPAADAVVQEGSRALLLPSDAQQDSLRTLGVWGSLLSQEINDLLDQKTQPLIDQRTVEEQQLIHKLKQTDLIACSIIASLDHPALANDILKDDVMFTFAKALEWLYYQTLDNQLLTELVVEPVGPKEVYVKAFSHLITVVAEKPPTEFRQEYLAQIHRAIHYVESFYRACEAETPDTASSSSHPEN